VRSWLTVVVIELCGRRDFVDSPASSEFLLGFDESGLQRSTLVTNNP
jgi:hypothetical protein